MDPDVEIVTRRVAALRRSMAKSEEQKAMIDEIYEGYHENDEPGCYRGLEELKDRTIAGEPGTAQRGRLRKRCKPFGPVGFLLESIFLQAAGMDCNYEIRQWNQPTIQIWQAPYQHLKPMVQQLCTRNRTKDGEDAREETQGLDEIDKTATEEGARKMSPDERMNLDIARTGSSWTRVAAYWAGQADDKVCQMCMEDEENAGHFWKCKKLEEARREADKELAEINPDILPHPVKQGIAPALSANSCCTFWGADKGEEGISEKHWKMIGGDADRKVDPAIKGKMSSFDPRTKAREVMQVQLQPKRMPRHPEPRVGRRRAAGETQRVQRRCGKKSKKCFLPNWRSRSLVAGQEGGGDAA